MEQEKTEKLFCSCCGEYLEPRKPIVMVFDRRGFSGGVKSFDAMEIGKVN